MAIRRIVQIVPALPPTASGVGDYALALASVLRGEFGLESQFVVANDEWQESSGLSSGFQARRLAERSAERLLDLLFAMEESATETDVLLQLSGYGYSRRGCPFWLLDGLRRWKQQRPRARLVTMFHELYAPAPVWSHTFWVGLAQKAAVGEIARLSDVAVTNIDRHRRWLERCDGSKTGKVSAMAIPSSVGEPEAPAPLSARKKSLVIFGLPPSRRRAYETRLAVLERACGQLGIAEVHDVGPAYEGIPQRIGAVPVIQYGCMEERGLSALLSQSLAGFVDYFPGYVAKSGIFASYCAHRMMPIMPQDGRSEDDGIRRGAHYHDLSLAAPAGLDEAQAVADAAWEWYQPHSMRQHARWIAGTLDWSRREQAIAVRKRA